MNVLIAEDEELTAEVLRNALSEFGYQADVARNGREAYACLRSGRYRMAVVDWQMPEMDGVELCRRIRGRRMSHYVYIVLLTSHAGAHGVVEGLSAGADDYLTKPFRAQELRLRLRTGERVLSLDSRDLIVFSLAELAESRDPETGAHLERIREYCRILAEELSARPDYRDQIDGDYIQLLYLTSPLHDIGKVGVPDSVLLKPGRLTPDEFKIMQQHSALGGRTLDAAARAYPEAHFLQMARDIVWTHHERYDGSGYPQGLAGTQIPLAGRIVAVADVYDALTSPRVYKRAFSHERARELLLEGRGSHFDPCVIDAFLSGEPRINDQRRQLAERPAGYEGLSNGAGSG